MIPDGWDGKALGVFDAEGKHRPWVEAWYWNMQQNWDCLVCLWRQDDLNPECSQGWFPIDNLRYDCDLSGPYAFRFYRHPITGFLHFQGSEFGVRLGILKPDYQKLKETWWYEGFDNSWPGLPRDCDLMRGYSKSFEVYFDRDKDGFFDTVMLDADNDGTYEKRFWYNPKAQSLTFCQNGQFFVSPCTLEFPSVSCELESYPQMQGLYKAAAAQFNERLLAQVDLAGSEVKAPAPLRFRADTSRRPVVAVDVGHTAGDSWRDHGPAGYTRLGTAFSRYPLSLRQIDRWKAETLKDVRMLVLLPMDFDRLPSDEEVSALEGFVRAGGTLVICYPESSNPAVVIFNTLLEPHGVGLDHREIRYDQGNDPHMNDPVHYRREDYLHGDPRVLEPNIRKLYFLGSPLRLTGNRAQPVVSYKDAPIAARVEVGKGTIYVFGTSLLNNRYTAHNVKGMPRSSFPYRQSMTDIWMMPDNHLLLEAVVQALLE
jgi:hypothetical protein